MTYIDRTDLVNAFGEVEISRLEFNITKSNEQVEQAKASTAAIISASNEVDSYLSVSYDLPLPSVPDSLKTKVCDVARYLMYKDKPTEEVEARYNKAISYFKDLSAGRAKLVFPIPPAGDQGKPSFISGIFVV